MITVRAGTPRTSAGLGPAAWKTVVFAVRVDVMQLAQWLSPGPASSNTPRLGRIARQTRKLPHSYAEGGSLCDL